MIKTAIAAITALSITSAPVHSADIEDILGGIIGLAIVNEIVNGERHHRRHYDRHYYDRHRPPVRGSHPNQVCSVHTEYAGQWVRQVETNCYGEVLRVTRHRRY